MSGRWNGLLMLGYHSLAVDLALMAGRPEPAFTDRRGRRVLRVHLVIPEAGARVNAREAHLGRLHPWRCPVARVLRRTFPGAVVRVSPAYFTLLWAGIRYHASPPEWVQARISAYDAGHDLPRTEFDATFCEVRE